MKTMEMNVNVDVMDVCQAAAWLKIHPVTLRRLAASGLIPAKKLGNQWRFSRQALFDYLGEPWESKKRPSQETSDCVDQSGTQTSPSTASGSSALQVLASNRKPKSSQINSDPRPGAKLSLVKSRK